MTYCPTIEEDIQRAKQILEKWRPDSEDLPPGLVATGGTIFGADIYAAYKLLESFVAELEDYDASFGLYFKASQALMRAFKAAHPDFPENAWPDATKVNVWAAGLIGDAAKVTRFEVVNHSPVGPPGRVLSMHEVKIELSYQDDGRTLKVFVTERETATECVPGSHVRLNGPFEPCQCGSWPGLPKFVP